jgi:hypothetical protein
MELPSLHDLDEFNRVIIAVSELTEKHQGCSVDSVTKFCASIALGGRLANHIRTLQLCVFAGLLSVEKQRVRLSQLGQAFLALNPTGFYETTEAQKIFVAERLILYGPWQSRARDLFLSFTPNYTKITYELSPLEKALPVRYNSTISLLKALGVLCNEEEKLFVAARYVAAVNELRSEIGGMTVEQLDQALRTNLKLSRQAEEAVREYERRRLKLMGRKAEAELVRVISQLNTEAGYDVESFDGDKPLFDYDRFIEVKASIEPSLRFFWSANERRVAEVKGDRYWIYFVGEFRPNARNEITPILIQNPASRLRGLPCLNIEAATYIISQSADLPLSPISVGGIKGFVL